MQRVADSLARPAIIILVIICPLTKVHVSKDTFSLLFTASCINACFSCLLKVSNIENVKQPASFVSILSLNSQTEQCWSSMINTVRKF